MHSAVHSLYLTLSFHCMRRHLRGACELNPTILNRLLCVSVTKESEEICSEYLIIEHSVLCFNTFA